MLGHPVYFLFICQGLCLIQLLFNGNKNVAGQRASVGTLHRKVLSFIYLSPLPPPSLLLFAHHPPFSACLSSSPSSSSLAFLETGLHCVDQSHPILIIFLLHSPECWAYRCAAQLALQRRQRLGGQRVTFRSPPMAFCDDLG